MSISNLTSGDASWSAPRSERCRRSTRATAFMRRRFTLSSSCSRSSSMRDCASAYVSAARLLHCRLGSVGGLLHSQQRLVAVTQLESFGCTAVR